MLTPAQSLKIAMDAAETSMAAATTIGMRMPMLFRAAMTGSPDAVRESQRMVNEKMVAAAQGAIAAGTAAMTLWFEMAATLSAPTAAQMAKVVDAGIAPARRAAKANARRLTGTRRRAKSR